MLDTILHHPRRLWVRGALFQMHLWAGILLSLYVIVIGLSGSLLVFQDEIRLISLRHVPLNRAGIRSSEIATIDTVTQIAHERSPRSQLTFVSYPQMGSPWWSLYLEDGHQRRTLAYADAATGEPLQQSRLFIDWVLDLHVYLLAGQTGFVINCVMGIGFMLLAITVAVIWWPGVRLWKRGFVVSMRRGWKRINCDAHNAVGIWTLAIVSWWGITAVYFLFPERISAAVNAISPLVGMKAPVAERPVSSASIATIESIVARVPSISSVHLSGVGLPNMPGDEVTVYFGPEKPGDFSHRDILTFDGHSGKLLSVWHYGENRSLGDWFLWLMYPLHFGTLWGLGFKVVWRVLDLGSRF